MMNHNPHANPTPHTQTTITGGTSGISSNCIVSQLPPPPLSSSGGVAGVAPACGAGLSAMTAGENTVLPPPPTVLVLKVGTSTLMETQKRRFSISNLGKFVDAVCNLKEKKYQVVLVSSGAVGAGCIHLKLDKRPTSLVGKQAASAVGQCRLIRLYEDIFSIREQKVAQLLITRTDLVDKEKFMNFRNTLIQLLSMGVIPIINENDSLATDALKFGDNDTLAAYVAIAISANWLFLLTDVDCLYTANPRHHSEAKPIPYVGSIDSVYQILDDQDNLGTEWGTGGMRTKVIAAKLCVATGIHTALCHGVYPERIIDILEFAEEQPNEEQQRSTTIISINNKQQHSGGGGGGGGAVTDAQFPAKQISTTGVKRLYHAANFNPTEPMTAITTQNSLIQTGGRVPTGSTPTAPTDISKEDDISTEQHHHAIQPESPQQATTQQTSAIKLVEDASIKPKSTSASINVADSLDSNDDENSDRPGLVVFPSLNEMPFLGTIFAAMECTQSIREQRRWILSLPVRGRIYVDEGCARAVVREKKSLFAAGIIGTKGSYLPGEAVAIYVGRAHLEEGLGEEHEAELARCLVNFSSAELEKIKGKKTAEFHNVLGDAAAQEVAHRSNIIFVNPGKQGGSCLTAAISEDFDATAAAASAAPDSLVGSGEGASNQPPAASSSALLQAHVIRVPRCSSDHTISNNSSTGHYNVH